MKNVKIKLRKSLRILYIIIALIIIILFSTLIYKKIVEKNNIVKKEILSFENKLNTEYSVNIKENPYILESSLPMEKVYITDLIDSIDMNLNYSYNSTEKTDIQYKYKIKGILTATYSNNNTNQKVWEKEYELKPITENSINGNIIEINEPITINLDSYNAELKNFEKDFGMSLDATLLIQMEVYMSSTIENVDFTNDYFTNIQIGLGEKTTEILGDLNETESKSIKQDFSDIDFGDIIVIIIYVIIIFMATLLLEYIVFNTKNSNILKNSYRMELNRILKSCDEKIVKLNNKLDLSNRQVIDVKDFIELLKLSEELFKPVLYWETIDKKQADFFIITNNIIYRYTLYSN